MVEIICKNYLLYTLMGVFVLGVLSRLILVLTYNRLKRSSSHCMAKPKNRLLRQIKLKYENYNKLEIAIPNIQTFVKRNMYEYRVMGLSLHFFEKVLGQAIFWCVVIGGFSAGYGYFMNINREIIMLYGITAVMFVVLLYNIGKVSDIEYLKENTELCIMEFLENHMRGHALEEEEEIQFSEMEYDEDGENDDIKNVGEDDELTEGLQMMKSQDDEIIEEVLNEIFC